MSDVVETILSDLDEKPTLSRTIGAVRRLEKLHAEDPGRFRPMRLAILRNFTIEPAEPYLKVAAYRAGVHLEVDYSGYDPSPDDVGLDADAVLVTLRLEELAPALATDFLGIDSRSVVDLAEASVERVVALAAEIPLPALVTNFVLPITPSAGLADSQDPAGQLNTVRSMNLALATRISSTDHAHVLDVDHLFSQLGLRAALDERGSRVGDAPLSTAALRTFAEAVVRHLLALRGPAVKCVVVDCDNTLWGGVVGEDGITGIVLDEVGPGRQHRDLQQRLLDLRRRGVVLALCSKNEEADVLEVLQKHPSCLLGEEDFATRRINWDDKAANIEAIAAELNLGLEHVAFIDDNPVECEWVQRRLPPVRVIAWPADVDERGGTLDDLALFDSLVVTKEDRDRTTMYRAEGERRAARAVSASHDDYLRSLDMVATVGSPGPEHVARLAQLTQRTNQFNLTVRRYDVAAVEALMAEKAAAIVWLDLRDRFGPHGIVGCGIVRTSGGTAVIDTLLLSCRVLGRRVEAVLVARLATLARRMGATQLVGEYVPSERNGQVADLYDRLGFERAGERRWCWSLERGDPEMPDWFEVVDADSGTAIT